MTNGEKIQTIIDVDRDCTEVHGENGTMTFTVTQDFWNAEYKKPINTIDYRRAFKIACDLLNGDVLYGVDTDKIYELMMQKDGVVTSSSYEEYILNHLQDLDQGQYLTENCIACKYDETEEEDGEHCKKCLSGDSQFELDNEFVEPTTKNNLALIRTEGLDEEIRCAMCTISMKSDRGCDGSCVVNKDMYKAVMDAIEKRIQPATNNNLVHNLCDSCTNIGCEFQSGIVRTECAFYMPPQLEPDSCGNYVVQGSTTKDCLLVEQIVDKVIEKVMPIKPKDMPSVTPQEPRVDFEELKRRIFMEVDGGTDDAWLAYGEVCDRISNAIDEFVSDMRGEEE